MSKFKSHKTVEQIAKKHRLDVSFIQKQLDMGEPIEHEHTKDHELARDIALQHLDEIPDYYTRLKKMESDAKKHHKKFKDVKVNEDLRNWFSKSHPEGNWKRYNSKGEAIGPCAREPGEAKPKCLSNEKAAQMSKNQIANAVKRKRKADPVADRKGKGGKPKMVSNRITEEHGNEEMRYCPLCAKRETRSQCSYGEKVWDKISVKDEEYSMARGELETMSKSVNRLKNIVGKGEGNLEAWVQSKITKAADYIDTVADYLESGEAEMQEAKDPCWTGYKQVGMKKKNGKSVPNCVSVNETSFEIKHTSSDVKKAKRAKKIDTLAQRGTGGEQKTAARMVGVSLPPVRKEELSLTDKILLEMEAEVLNEKNVPTNPSLWSKMKAKAKAKFDVYPSAYANGWAAKEYKKAGGEWKSANESVSIEDANGNTFAEVVDLILPDPIVSEATRLQAQTGNVIAVTIQWRGKYYSLRVFFPYVKLPSRKEITDELQKIYPGCVVVYHAISDFIQGQPLVQSGPQGGSFGKPGPSKNYVKPMGEETEINEDWQKVNRQDKTDGLSRAAVKAYRSENPGSKLQTAVTEKKPSGKRDERRKSFCRRMKGMKNKLTSSKTARDPDSRINKALRRWNCN
ncbi:MAG: DUF5661 family protein [Candidatus Nanopelagicales bacterium]